MVVCQLPARLAAYQPRHWPAWQPASLPARQPSVLLPGHFFSHLANRAATIPRDVGAIRAPGPSRDYQMTMIEGKNSQRFTLPTYLFLEEHGNSC